MARVTGIGGVFFKSRDPEALKHWYKENLGVECEAGYGAAFEWRELDAPEKVGFTVWAPFPSDTRYFEPSGSSFMVNFRVDDLDAVLARLRAAGVSVDERVEDHPNGRFGWFMDPDGRRIELWEQRREP